MINDLIAYLIVLDYLPVLNKLTRTQYEQGKYNLLGCLHRLEKSIKNEEILHAILTRESLNGTIPYGNGEHRHLSEITENLAKMIYELIEPTESPWKVGLNDKKPPFWKFLS